MISNFIAKYLKPWIGIFILLFVLQLGQSQEIKFYEAGWEDILWRAHLQNKAIFGFVEADWCQEGNTLKKSLQSDEELVDYLNRHFVSVNINEKDELWSEIKRKYPVLGFPTLLFIDQEGELILSELGMMESNSLLDLAARITSNYSNREFREKLALLDENRYDEKYLKELTELEGNDIYSSKTKVYDYFFNALLASERPIYYPLFKENLTFASPKVTDLIIDEYQRPSGFLISTEQRQEHAEFVSLMEKKIKYFYKEAQDKRDLNLLDLTGEISKKLARKKDRFNTIFVKDAVEEYDKQLLNFFKNNEMLRDYALQAIDVIDKYVLIKSPTQMRDADLEREEYPVDAELNYCFKKPMDYDPSNNTLDSLFRLKEKLQYSYEAASLMDDICKHYLVFFEDEGALNKAAYWSSMSYRYFNSAEFYLTHARILWAQTKEEEALNKAKEGLALGSPDSNVEEALNLFIYAIEGESEVTSEN